MFLLIAVLLHQGIPALRGTDALMVIQNYNDGEQRVIFAFEKDGQVRIGFYGVPDKHEILHLSKFVELYKTRSNEILRTDAKRLSLDRATIERLELAIDAQLSLIRRRAMLLSSKIEGAGLERQFEIQTDGVKAAGALLTLAISPINSRGTLYCKILSARTNAEMPERIDVRTPRFAKGAFSAKMLSDPAWHESIEVIPK